MRIVNIFSIEDITRNMGDDGRLIIFGAGDVAQEALAWLDEAELLNKVEFVVDNDAVKQGKRYKAGGYAWQIKSPEVLREIESNFFIVVTTLFYAEIIKQLNTFDNLKDAICFVYITHPLENLTAHAMKYYKIDLAAKGLRKDSIERLADERKSIFYKKIDEKLPFVIPKINYHVTTKCTLACRDCSQLTTYFNRLHKHYEADIQTLKKDIDNLLRAVDYIGSFSFIGGETFIYPYLGEAIEYAAKSDKILEIILATNGTVFPDEVLLQALMNHKVYVKISDYGHIEKLGRLVSLFEKNNVSFCVTSEPYWVDLGNIDARNKSIDELRKNYGNCSCSQKSKSMAEGRLWACHRGCVMNFLGAFESSHDSITITNDDTVDEIRKKMLELFSLDYAESCDHCGYRNNPRRIKAGIQENDSFRPSQYTLISRKEYQELTEASKRTQYLE